MLGGRTRRCAKKNTPHLDACLRGIKKVHASTSRIRLALTTDILCKVGSVLHSKDTNRMEAMLWAVLCTGFHGALRCAEFTVKGKFNEQVHLCRGDIRFLVDRTINQEYVELHLKTSKTDPFHKGCNIVLFRTNQIVCPVSALRVYLSLYPNDRPSDPLFHAPNGDVLTRVMYVKLLQDALRLAGYNAELYNGHSLRKGFATSASAGKVPDHVLCAMGRWQSDCYKTYINTPMSVIANAQRVISDPNILSNL